MMFTEKDEIAARYMHLEKLKFLETQNATDEFEREWAMTIDFIFLKLAKLENENKELRDMITGEHEVMT